LRAKYKQNISNAIKRYKTLDVSNIETNIRQSYCKQIAMIKKILEAINTYREKFNKMIEEVDCEYGEFKDILKRFDEVA